MQFPLQAHSQSCELKISLDQSLSGTNFNFFLFYGNKPILLDSINNGTKDVKIPIGYTGFVRISGSGNYEDIILDNESFAASIIPTTNGKWKTVINGSVQNKQFQNLKSTYLDYSSQLSSTVNENEKLIIKEKRKKICDSILDVHPNNFFSRSTRLAMMDYQGLSSYAIIDAMPLTDPDLIHSSILTSMLMKSFAAIGSPDEDELKKVIKYFFEKQMDVQVKEMLSISIIEFFTKTNNDNILQFISDNFFIDNHCELNLDADAKIKFARTLLFRSGNQLPDVSINGEFLSERLKKIKPDQVLLVIWSLDCPHCVKALYNPSNKVSKNMYRIGIELSGKMIEKTPLILNQNIQEKDGWDSDIIKKLQIDRTPFYILINKNLKINSILNEL